MKIRIVSAVISLSLMILLSILVSNLSYAASSTIPLVSTRNHFNLGNGGLINGHNKIDSTTIKIPGLEPGTSCPREVAIYVHGVWANQQDAVEQTTRTNMSLNNEKYRIQIIGFTWDSNTAMDSQGYGWNIAKKIAQQNGPKLANFLVNYMTVCKLQNHQNTDIRIIGHSLGARVILSALAYLNSNQTWNSENLKIKSVHLLGAAVDQDSPSVNSLYGRAIANTTKKFYNLYDGLDDILYSFYYLYDNKYPLGLYPASNVVPIPQNLREEDVASSGMYYRDADRDGHETCFEDLMNWPSVLQNHCAYMGARDPIHHNLLIDDGAIQFVVDDWRSQP